MVDERDHADLGAHRVRLGGELLVDPPGMERVAAEQDGESRSGPANTLVPIEVFSVGAVTQGQGWRLRRPGSNRRPLGP
jgi:hypothetical protein